MMLGLILVILCSENNRMKKDLGIEIINKNIKLIKQISGRNCLKEQPNHCLL